MVDVSRTSSLAHAQQLHQFLPAVLTCVVGKRLTERAGDERHWGVRDNAAALTAMIMDKYGNQYNDVQVSERVRAWGCVCVCVLRGRERADSGVCVTTLPLLPQ
jgi:hypothetical protein